MSRVGELVVVWFIIFVALLQLALIMAPFILMLAFAYWLVARA